MASSSSSRSAEIHAYLAEHNLEALIKVRASAAVLEPPPLNVPAPCRARTFLPAL